MNKLVVIIVSIVVIALILTGVVILIAKSRTENINSFDECAAAGYPILESYPEQCKTPNGKTFTRVISSKYKDGEEVTIVGVLICLPHKEKGGIQTLECAIGLNGPDDQNFSLSDPQMKYIVDLPMDKTVRVTGIFKQNELANIYDSVGKIEISNFELVNE
jgi:hypothetical protein